MRSNTLVMTKKKEVSIVFLVLVDDSTFGYVNWGERERFYAFCTNREEAQEIKEGLNRLGKIGLTRLKIVKKDEYFIRADISMPYRLDNFDAIIAKLNKSV